MDIADSISFAASMLQELKSQLSIEDLNTCIFLFREVLFDSECTPTDPVYADGIKNLAFALSVRYMYFNQKDDLGEAWKIYHTIEDTWPSAATSTATTNNVSLLYTSLQYIF